MDNIKTKEKEIFKHFDTLNKDKSHHVTTNDICTPMGCVKEMVDSVPEEFWKQKELKILDCCCGNGNFPAYIETKTELKNLYFNEINETRIQNIKDYFGSNINLTNKDFLTFPDKEEYDLIVANPPYAKFAKDGSRGCKSRNLSRDFAHKAFKLIKPEGYILFIIPNNWMSYANINVLPEIFSKHQFRHIDIHGAKKWFPKVGSSFTWFLLQKSPNKEAFTIANNYVIKDKQEVKLPEGVKFIPLYYSKIVSSIIEKTVTNADIPKYKVQKSSFFHSQNKKRQLRKTQDETYKYQVMHTPNQTLYSDIPHPLKDGWKVFIPLTSGYETFVRECGMTASVGFIQCVSKEEAEKISKELNAPIFKFLSNIARYGNFNNFKIMQRLPILGSFKLEQEEIDLIEQFNGKYYQYRKKNPRV